MSERNDGGPAFGHGNPEQGGSSGMSLRDWFAGQALAGFMAQSHAGPKEWTDMGHGWGEDTVNGLNSHKEYIAATMAVFAYAMADALLAERAKKPTP